MQGACSNQIVKCIIYTSDIDIGRDKLFEIEREKNASGITTIRANFSSYHNEMWFSDGEEWIVLNPGAGVRGYRWRKAWIDASNTSISDLQCNILPYGSLYQWEKEKYFNW